MNHLNKLVPRIEDKNCKTKYNYSEQLREKHEEGTSLVVQWLRIHLPMQGTRVRALVREDPTCYRANKPVHYNY